MPARRHGRRSSVLKPLAIGAGVLTVAYLAYKSTRPGGVTGRGPQIDPETGLTITRKGGKKCTVEGYELGPPGCAANEVHWQYGCVNYGTCKDMGNGFMGIAACHPDKFC
jgi:hypothetical protein